MSKLRIREGETEKEKEIERVKESVRNIPLNFMS